MPQPKTRPTEAPPLTRSEKMKAALQAKRAAMPDPGFHPCVFCGQPIPKDRCKDAIARGKDPQYCSEDCRANKPTKSLALAIYESAIADLGPKGTEAMWQAEYVARIASVVGRKKKRRSK